MFSKNQRKWLLGILKPSKSYKRKLRHDIKEKFDNAIQDIAIVTHSPYATDFSNELSQLATLLSPYLNVSYNRQMVDRGGLEPPTSPMPREHSTSELPARFIALLYPYLLNLRLCVEIIINE